MEFESYIMPELVVLIPALYLVGMGLKRMERFQDRMIPVMLGCVGMLLASVYMFGVQGVCWGALYFGIVQGVLCAGASVYANQLYKQTVKE